MMGFGFGGFGMVFMLLFWLGIVGLAIWFLSSVFPRTGSRSADDHHSSPSALDVLKERYARGEISKAEYEEMRRVLQL